MSKIEVNTVDAQCGSTITVGSSGKNVKIEGNDIRSNDYKASDGGNIINQCGTTITLGASGDTINLASGASQSGFGRTGTVDWQTGSIKTATFTAANGEGYFANTSGGAFTMNLPAGTAGNIVSVVDYTNTFQTNNLTISPNGSQKIGGVAGSNTLSTEGQSVTFVYVDDTEGWKNVQDSTSNVTGSPFLQATGGTVTTSGNCKIHTFTGPGTFTVAAASQTAAENIVSYLVIGGGGGSGGGQGTGGGGAGGMRELVSPSAPYSGSPLNGYPTPGNRITVTAQAYPITVGGGGAGAPYGPGVQQQGTSGVNSIFSSITSTGGGGGGGGGGAPNPAGVGGPGGSGGGGGGRDGGCKVGGTGNTPPVSPAQGTNGGPSTPSSAPPSVDSGGGGGGASTAGGAGTANSAGGNGGPGHGTSITGSPVNYAGGGGGGSEAGGASSGGTGGGGAGSGTSGCGTAGTANTGGGGGGTGVVTCGAAAGGSGIVVIRYKFQ